MTTEKLVVDDMQCQGCAGRVRNVLMKIPGVVKVITSLDDHTAEVTFDERSTSGDKLSCALQTAGFRSAEGPAPASAPGEKCC